jgi:hypothetical protein
MHQEKKFHTNWVKEFKLLGFELISAIRVKEEKDGPRCHQVGVCVCARNCSYPIIHPLPSADRSSFILPESWFIKMHYTSYNLIYIYPKITTWIHICISILSQKITNCTTKQLKINMHSCIKHADSL